MSANSLNIAKNALNNAAKKKAVNNAAAAELGLMASAVEEPSANAASTQANGANSKPAGNASGNALKPANVGGRRRTKRAKGSKRCTMKGGKISKGASKWNLFVMRTFKDMRKKNKSVKLMDAMKECSKQKKKGVKY